MRTLTVDLAERSYPIHIGSWMTEAPELLAASIAGSQVLVVSNETIAPLYLAKLTALLPAELMVNELVLPDGERYKNYETLNRIYDNLLENSHNRTTTLIALGGGVIGDMCGFAAATYQRGVNFIQVPTTLLAQVDSSVGGKTAVNHPLGKNMIGAFHQPKAVLIDVSTLQTLPPREFACGLAEVIKYGLIADPVFYKWLEENLDGLLAGDVEKISYAIDRSCHNKADIVAQDEKEAGVRAWLNLGHTFGHAIEAFQHYRHWLHGEAVAAGMVIAGELSRRLGYIDEADCGRICSLLSRAGLPTKAPGDMTVDDFMQRMKVDKKNRNGQLRLILLQSLGQALISDDAPPEEIAAAITACQ